MQIKSGRGGLGLIELEGVKYQCTFAAVILVTLYLPFF